MNSGSMNSNIIIHPSAIYTYVNNSLQYTTNSSGIQLETGKTITASNVLANNETRLAACESALNSKASSSHSHSISDITNLQSTLNGKASTSHTHSGYASSSHSHSISDISNLQSTLNGKASTSHTHSEYASSSHSHSISNITNLQSTLNNKASTSSSNTFSGSENRFPNKILIGNSTRNFTIYYGETESYSFGMTRITPYLYFDYIDSGTSNRVVYFTNNDVYCNCDITCRSLTQTSDRRLKEDINEIPEEQSTNVIDNLKVYSYYFKNRNEESAVPHTKKIHYGVIAQELQELAPELVSTNDISDEHYLSVNYVELIPHLINKIHAQDKRINELENKVNRLCELLEQK